MLPTTAPTSQKYRPISFVLDDQATLRAPIWVPLVIRPEDLTRTDPTRATVHQTLGQNMVGWVDSFGPGLPTINISGHTGWRAPAGQSDDGASQFATLRQSVFDEWHLARKLAVNFGLDPAMVKLLFVDELDAFAVEVAPMTFTLRRSKSRPLLMQYNIQMQVVSTSVEVPERSVESLGDIFEGMESLQDVIDTITGVVDSVVSAVRSFIAPIANAVRGFLNFTKAIFSAVSTVVGAVLGGVRTIANDLIGIARDVASAGKNIFDTISMIASIPADVKHMFKQVAGAFRTAFCLFGNSFKAKGRTYPDYSDVYGSSNCSSTTGGRSPSPLISKNVFKDLRPTPSPIIMSPDGMGSLKTLSSTDPVLEPMSTDELGRNMAAVTSGFGGFSPDYTAKVEETTGVPAVAYA